MAMKNKTKTTNPSVVLEVYVVVGLSMKRINMYIDHDSSVGVCFSSKRSRIASASAMLFRFPPFHVRWRVGHVLVLVFAATRRHLVLQAARRSRAPC